MSGEFAELRSDVKNAKSDIRANDHRLRLSFLQEYYEVLDSFLVTVLDSLDELCAEDTLKPSNKEDVIKDGVYEELQRVRRIHSEIHSQRLPIELYYLLQDIKDDLSINTHIGLDPGSKPERNFLVSGLRDRFKVLEKIIFWNIWESDNKNPQIINIPRSELRRSLSYSLIAHECFHVKDNLVSNVVDKFEELDVDIKDSHHEEAAIDILSLNYMGPVYAERLVQIPNKIGVHESDSYPEFDVRLGYSIRYIDWLSEEGNQGPSNSPVQRKPTEKDHKFLYDRLEGVVYQKLNNERTGRNHVFDPAEFKKLQLHIQEIFSGQDIPTYEKERENLRGYLGMPKAEARVVIENLNTFILDKGAEKIALPIKPTLLLNLILLVDDYGNKDMTDVVLSSFKKWYVTDRTREKLNQ